MKQKTNLTKTRRLSFVAYLILGFIAIVVLIAGVWVMINNERKSNSMIARRNSSLGTNDTLNMKDTVMVMDDKVYTIKSYTVNDSTSGDQVIHMEMKEYFYFKNSSLEEILKELSRSYDVDIVYEGKEPDRRYTKTIYKFISLEEMIKILQQMGMPVRLKDRKIIVEEEKK